MNESTYAGQKVVVFDFGAQYGQLIARRVRDLHVYSEIVPCDISADEVRAINPAAIILSGGPASVYAEDAPSIDPDVLELGIPVLGFCYGQQIMAVTLGARSEQELRRLSALDPLEALVYDAACSSFVEAAADALEDEVVRYADACGMVTNGRFSPGYGDFPLEAQPSIVRTLRADIRLGLTVLPTHLLLPTKSITSVLGLFDVLPSRHEENEACASCALRATCEMRKRGVVCHGRTRT